MPDHIRLGMLTPSSNTVLEPVTAAMTAQLPHVTCHYSRFRVTRISLDKNDLRQFDTSAILAAAQALADARVQVVAWSGTSGSWLGEANDRNLCDSIHAATGIDATTSILAMSEVLEKTNSHRIGLVTPYVNDVQQQIIANYECADIDCIAERHLEDHGNFSFANWSEEEITRLIREVAVKRPDAIVVLCTNFRAAPVVEQLEHELDIPIFDSIAVVVWKSLKMSGIRPDSVRGWGRLFESVQ